jgi:DNA-binding NtrC family response regulator
MPKRFGTTLWSKPEPADDSVPSRPHLLVIATPDAQRMGHSFPLTARRIRIGRELDAGPYVRVTVDDERVSRLHAEIVFERGGHAHIEDRDSRNGLFLDGARIGSAELSAGSVIRVGETLLVVTDGLPGASEDATALGLVGRAPSTASVRDLIRRIGSSALSVLITGETGTGKEVVARAIHAESKRTGPFVPVNCAALPAALVESLLFGHRKGAYTGATSDEEGVFAQAHGGTLFLDEIGELVIEAQAKLLRVLEDGEVTPVGAGRSRRVDVRVVTATNVPLGVAIRAGRFRDDLYARLAGVAITTHPLRERREDVLMLFQHFASAFGAARSLSADFAEKLVCASWPRNVRELAKLAERLSVLHPNATRWEASMLTGQLDAPEKTGRTDAADPPRGALALDRARPPRPATRENLIALLRRFDGNVTQLAAFVGRSRKQVYRWMDELGIERNTGRD